MNGNTLLRISMLLCLLSLLVARCSGKLTRVSFAVPTCLVDGTGQRCSTSAAFDVFLDEDDLQYAGEWTEFTQNDQVIALAAPLRVRVARSTSTLAIELEEERVVANAYEHYEEDYGCVLRSEVGACYERSEHVLCCVASTRQTGQYCLLHGERYAQYAVVGSPTFGVTYTVQVRNGAQESQCVVDPRVSLTCELRGEITVSVSEFHSPAELTTVRILCV
jgi:hypothetical protein